MILFVEDDSKDADLALAALVKYNSAARVEFVRDGEEALDYLHYRGKFKTRSGGAPAVVVLDLKMPKMDGMQVLRQVKSDPDLKSVPIVILTASREERDLVESYHLGVNAYVVKPVDFHEFIDAVKELGLFWGIVNVPPPQKGAAGNDNRIYITGY